jgi:hypothetical protein
LTLTFQLLTSRIGACLSCEGGEIVHLGEIFNGDIKHNSIVFNQSSNRPAIPTSGAGIEWQQVTVSNNIVANNPEV